MANIFWASGDDGNFSDSTNWTPQTVPGAADVAVINVSGAYTVQGVPLADITIAGMIIGNANATLSVPFLTTLEVFLNSFQLTGTVTLGGALVFASDLAFHRAAHGTGTISMASGQILPASAGLKVVNHINILGSGTIGNGTDMLLNNLGAVTASDGQLTINTGSNAVINHGTLQPLQSNTLEVDNTLRNYGSILSQESDAFFNSSRFHGTGEVFNYAGGTIKAQNVGVIDLDSSVTNRGDLFALNLGSINLGALTNIGDVEATSTGIGASITVAGNTLNGSSGTIQASGFDGSISFNGGLSNAGQVTASGNSTLVTVGASARNQGTITSDGFGASIIFNDTVVNAPAGEIVANNSGTVTFKHAVTSSGTLTASGGTLTFVDDLTLTGFAELQADSGGVIEVDGTFSGAFFTSVLIEGPNSKITFGDVSHSSGSVEAENGGTVIFQSDLINTAFVETCDSSLHQSQVTFQGNITNMGAGQLVATEGGILTFAGNLTLSGNFTLLGFTQLQADTGGQIEVDGTFSGAFFASVLIEDPNSKITFGDVSHFLGSIEAENGGTVIFHSDLTNAAFVEACDSSFYQSQVTFQGDIANRGVGQLVATEGGKLDVMGDVLKNAGFIGADTQGLVTLHGDVVNNSLGSISATSGGLIDILGTVSNYGQIGSDGADPDTSVPSTVTLEGALVRNIGTIETTAAQIDVANILSNQGDLSATKGTISIGTLVNTGTVETSTDDGSTIHVLGNTKNSGTITVGFQFTIDGTLTNTATGQITGDGFGSVMTVDGRLVYGGKLEVDQGAEFDLNGDVAGSGTIKSVGQSAGGDPSTIKILGTLSSAGNLIADGGFLFIQTSKGNPANAAINHAGHLELGAGSNAHITFDDSGKGILSLQQPLQLTGDITGFITGDTVELEVAPSSVGLDYEENGGHTGGVLHVQNNGAEIAALNIVGAGYDTGQFSHDDSAAFVTIHVQHDLII